MRLYPLIVTNCIKNTVLENTIEFVQWRLTPRNFTVILFTFYIVFILSQYFYIQTDTTTVKHETKYNTLIEKAITVEWRQQHPLVKWSFKLTFFVKDSPEADCRQGVETGAEGGVEQNKSEDKNKEVKWSNSRMWGGRKAYRKMAKKGGGTIGREEYNYGK